MTPSARLSAAIEVFSDLTERRRPANDALKDWGLARRFAGSGDRAAVSALVYDGLRKKSSAAWIMGAETPRAILLGTLHLTRGMSVEAMMKDPNIILNQIKLNKEKFLVRSWEKSADSLVITNGMPGSVTLSFQTESVPGLTYRLEKTELSAGESAQLEVIYDPQDPSAKPTLKASLKIDPLGKTIIIPIVFDIPEEIKKQLPKQ